MPYLVATTDGLIRVDDQGTLERLAEGSFRHVVPGRDDGEAVALDSDGQLWDVDDEGAAPFAEVSRGTATCLLVNGEDILVGTDPAGLLRRDGDDFARIDGFDRAPGSDKWTTPWGAPAAVRTID